MLKRLIICCMNLQNKFAPYKSVVRILIGLLFVVSAVFKAISIDEFDIYLYSFGILDFVFCTLLSRLIILFEFALGVMFIFNLYFRSVWLIITSTTGLFTLFLIYVQLFRHDSNCHCMGDIVELDPLHSIVKNLGIIGLMLLIRKAKEEKFKNRKWFTIGLVGAAFIAILIIIPPNSFYNFIYSGEKTLNTVEFNKTMSDSTYYTRIVNLNYDEQKKICKFDVENVALDLSNDKYLLAYIHSGCKYCKLGMKKINMMIENNEIDPEHVIMLIWGDDEHISEFILDTKCFNYECRIMEAHLAVGVTNGHFPTFVFYDSGEVVEVFDYNNINEKSIVEFFE